MGENETNDISVEENNDFNVEVGNDFTSDVESVTANTEFKKDTEETLPDTEEKKEEPVSALTGGLNHPSKDKEKKDKKIDLFNEEVAGKPLNFSDIKTSKTLFIAMANEDDKLPEEIEDKFKVILRKLAKKGYKVRMSCMSSKVPLPLVDGMFDYEDIEIYKPWNKFCKTTGFKSFMPTNKNIETAAYYSKNFNTKPTAVKYFISSFFQILFGSENNNSIEFIIIYDPHLTKNEKGYDKVDFKKSPGTADIHYLGLTIKEKSFNVYNLHKKEDVNTLLELLED